MDEKKQEGEQEKEKEKKPEETKDNSGEGDKPKAPDFVERAESAAERLEKANEESKVLLAKQALGGRADAGMMPEETKEPTPEEAAAKFLKGEYSLTG